MGPIFLSDYVHTIADIRAGALLAAFNDDAVGKWVGPIFLSDYVHTTAVICVGAMHAAISEVAVGNGWL